MGGPAPPPRGRPRPPTSARSPRVLDDARPRGARTGRGRAGQQRRREPASRRRVRGAGAGERRPRACGRCVVVTDVADVGRRDRRRARGARASDVAIGHGSDADRRRASDDRGRPARGRGPRRGSGRCRRRGARATATERMRHRRTPTAGNESSTSTPGSPTGSAPTRPGSARSPTSRRRATGRSGSSPWSTPRRPAGASRAQAAAQLARAAHSATSDRVDAFAISVEAAGRIGARPDRRGRGVPGERRRTPARCPGPSSSSRSDWLGLRSHPRPAGTISFGGPDVPGWLDGALRDHGRRRLAPSCTTRRAAWPHRSNASSTRTSTCGIRRAPTGTRTSPASVSSTWATSRACAASSTNPPTSRSRRTGTS